MEEKFDRWWMWWIRETIYRREELYISLDYRPTFLLFWNFGLQLWSNLTMVNIKIPDMLSVSMSVLLLYYLTFFWGGWLCNVVLNWISFPHWTNRKKVNIQSKGATSRPWSPTLTYPYYVCNYNSSRESEGAMSSAILSPPPRRPGPALPPFFFSRANGMCVCISYTHTHTIPCCRV